MHFSAAAFVSTRPAPGFDSDQAQFLRYLTVGLRPHQKKAHLLRLWNEACHSGHVVLAASIAAYVHEEEPPQPHLRAPFNFNSLSDSDCVAKFRFGKAHIESLVAHFEFDTIRTRERTAATGVEGLCVVLYKLAVPIRVRTGIVFWAKV
ncbi:hypothetical protein PPTG_21513 [Phytophthora nicotianae INRA-310]|uniref:Uncharacterized protein n=1 Tax=Phytophthora nicotianae (strain INRA-310) TaxID=761204 RepID=W2R036_PHYN3|nr:hypothetical protein PPTG_21513 [Phytophthora nicotianae INRA-310]ETN18089.1 hypothetical protein PPTG_21513 [Phytophthora nicotianae INRA-310]